MFFSTNMVLCFFNIKILTSSLWTRNNCLFEFLASIPLIILCNIKIKIEGFSKVGIGSFIGFVNLVIAFISYGIKAVRKFGCYTDVEHSINFYNFRSLLYKKRKFNLIKTIGVLIGFSGIVYLFSDNILINQNNFYSAF